MGTDRTVRVMSAALLLGTVSVLGAAPLAAQADYGVCGGDCNGDAVVSTSELVTGVHLALGTSAPTICTAFPTTVDGGVEVSALVTAVGYALHGCPLGIVAEKAFFDTLNGVRDRADEAELLLQRAVEADPQDGRASFLLGMLQLWRLSGEDVDLAEPPAVALTQIERASAALDTAVPLLPDDARIPGFRAAATYVRGVLSADAETEQLGLSQLRASFSLYPLFNTFDFIGTVPALIAPDDPLLAEAVGYLDFALSPAGLAQCTPRICFNAGQAPHNIEGSFLLFGDIFAKAGARDQAMMYYQGSAAAAATSGWRFRDVINERVATLDDRIARYGDDDPDNDPPVLGRFGTQSCAYCHYR